MARRRFRRSPSSALVLLGTAALATLLWCGHKPPPRQPTPASTSVPLPSSSLSSHPVSADLAASVFSSRADCQSIVRAGARLPRSPGSCRVASWNVRWFPYGRVPGRSVEPATDVAWLACVLAWLDADAVAMQEVVLDERGSAAVQLLAGELDKATGGRWQTRFDSCRGTGRQHVGLLVNTQAVQLSGEGELAALNPGRGPCDDSLRPGYAAYLAWPGGPDFFLVSVHLDSGSAQRDYQHRVRSLARLSDAVGELQARFRDTDVLVAGDFNTMGCDTRGGCRPPVAADAELLAIDGALGRQQPPFRRVPADQPCTEYYRGRGHNLDHVLVSQSFRELPSGMRVQVQGDCLASRCRPRSGQSAAYASLSDHCPIVLDIPRADLDP